MEKVFVEVVEKAQNSKRGTNSFSIKRDEYNRILGKYSSLNLVAIYHSHKKTTTPSLVDIEGMRKSKIVWLIGASANEEFLLNGYYFHEDKIKKILIHLTET